MSGARPTPVAQQERSRRTRRAILDAGFALLAEGGLPALTVPEVSSRAGVSVGTVYRRFGDKEGLLRELLLEFTTGFNVEWSRRIQASVLAKDARPSAIVAVGVRALVSTFESQAPLLRVFAERGLHDAATFEQGQRVSLDGGALFRELVWPAHDAITHPDPERAIDVAWRLMYAACMHRVLQGPNLESATVFGWGDLADELTRAVDLVLFGHLASGA